MNNTEKEKMLSGELYNPLNAELSHARQTARELCKSFNDSDVKQTELRQSLLKQLIPDSGKQLWIEPPFHCDYGDNIRTGKKVFFNFNCIVLDCAPVSIGSNVFIGPAVQIYTAVHPVDAIARRSMKESALPVFIGDDVWIGGGAIICPGVSIGDRTVIGAGSVVTKDIPADVVAAGNPCKIIKSLIQE